MKAAMRASPARLRGQALAIRCARLREAGWTTNAIARAVGKRPERIKSLVALGERLKTVLEED